MKIISTIALLTIPFTFLISCATPPKPSSYNNKLVHNAKEALINEDFKEAKNQISMMSYGEDGIATYRIGRNIYHFPVLILGKYIDRLEGWYKKFDVLCPKANTINNSKALYEAKNCLRHSNFQAKIGFDDDYTNNPKYNLKTYLKEYVTTNQCEDRPNRKSHMWFCSPYGNFSYKGSFGHSGGYGFIKAVSLKRLEDLDFIGDRIVKTENIADQKKWKAQERKEAAYTKSSRWALDETCSNHRMLTRAKNKIQEEKEGAKYSGIVDKNNLYRYGQQIRIYNKAIKKSKVLYKKRSGKSWNSSLCKG